MDCIDVVQELERKIISNQTVETIFSLLGGILIALIILAIILIIRYRKVIKKKVSINSKTHCHVH